MNLDGLEDIELELKSHREAFNQLQVASQLPNDYVIRSSRLSPR